MTIDESALRESKRPRSILAGPYGHPFHALLITIPIGAWTASLVFDIVAGITGDTEAFSRGAVWLIGIGIAGAVLAAITGLMDYSTLRRGTKAKRVALIHAGFNTVAIVLFSISLAVRIAHGYEDASVAGIVLSVVAILAVAVSGTLGGELAYRYGIRVADETTQREAFSK
ncbi:MAG TPA: DUF2231 domain-containing protein [Rhodoglobus sp.]|nr:DUF2231 domain-containing protein [Rhodoglobus sp.]